MSNIDVFISHHTKTCLPITEAICNELESNGIRVWYAPRNTEDAYARSIVQAIKSCKVFILVLNKESSYSEDCLNEINLAVERIRKKEEISILPFHVSEEEISDDAKYYLGRIHWIDAIEPPMKQRIKELSSRVMHVLDVKATQNNSQQSEMILKSNYSPSINDFIGRKEELKKLKEDLFKYRKILVQGMGGIGKSELVKTFIEQNKNEFNTIIFSTYEDSIINLVIKDSYFDINNFDRKINKDGNQESDLDYFKRKMDTIRHLSNEKTLIVIDNFDTLEDDYIEEFINSNFNLIITSRYELPKYDISTIKLNAIESKNDLFNIFQNNYRLNIQEDEINIINSIIDIVGKHTLTITLIAKMMYTSRIKPIKMLENLKQKEVSLNVEGEINHKNKSYNSLYSCLKVLFDISNLSDDEKYILKRLALIDISGISVDCFMSLCNLDNGLLINRLIRKSLIMYDYVKDYIYLHPLIKELTTKELLKDISEVSDFIHNVSSKYNWDMSINDKIKYGKIAESIFITFPDFDISQAKDFIGIAHLLRDNRNFEMAKKIYLKAIEELSKDYGNNILEIWKAYGGIKHLEYTYNPKNIILKEYNLKRIKILENKKEYELQYAESLKELAGYYIANDDYENSLKYMDQAFEIYNKNENTNDCELGAGYLFYARTYVISKEYEKALDYARKSFEYLYRYSNEYNNDVSSALLTIGKIYLKIGNIKEAIKYLEQVLDIRSHSLINEDVSILSIKELLAEAYFKDKNFVKAIEFYEEVSDILKRNYVDVEERIININNMIIKCKKHISEHEKLD